MKYKEEQVEELIYSSPWLLNENYLIPQIKGSRGEFGRQINIGNSNSRYIDLLFKDSKDERPVIVELKRGKITRENVAQILEYRALIVSMSDDQKEDWIAEFGQNYYAPKMLLMGSEINFETMLSANLAGVEFRCFGKAEKKEWEFDFDSIKSKIDDWNSLRNSGKRGLGAREEWTKKVVNSTNRILNEISSELSTIKKQPIIREKEAYYEHVSPFINLPIWENDDWLMGIYEYYSDNLPLDEKYFYFEICLDQFYEEQDPKIEIEINKFLKSFPHARITDNETTNAYFKADRKFLEEGEYGLFLKNVIGAAQSLRSEIKKITQQNV